MMLDVELEAPPFRTTIAIDDDVLTAAKTIARQKNETLGKVVSELARKSLRRPSVHRAERNGVLLLPVRKAGVTVTPEIVNALRDESLWSEKLMIDGELYDRRTFGD